MIRIEHNPTRRQLTVFRLLWLVLFGVFGGCRGGKPACLRKQASSGRSERHSRRWPGLARSAADRFPGSVLCNFSDWIRGFIHHLGRGILFGADSYRPCLAIDGLRSDASPLRSQRQTYWSPREPEETTERYFKQF